MKGRGRAHIWLLLLAAGACVHRGGEKARAEVAVRTRALGERLATARSGRDSTAWDRPVARWELPSMIAEISGLALTGDGRLLAHGDETGDLFQIDYRGGIVVKRFRLGPEPVREDFEALAVRDSVLMLVTSRGRIFEFPEGDNGEVVPYRTYDLRLDGECREFEGAAWDARGTALVLACKTPAKARNDFLLIYRVSLADSARGAFDRIEVPFDSIDARGGTKKFAGSDLAIRPDNGNYVLIAGPEKGYLEVTPAGAIVTARRLPPRHPQAEGIAVTRDGMLLIADEAVRGPAAITVYPAPLR